MKHFSYILLSMLILLTTAQMTAFGQGEVTRSGDTWTAEVNNNVVYSGNDMMDAIQSAMNNLTPGRTSKETVHVRNSGDTGPHEWDGDVKHMNMPDYTIIDFHGNTINVNDGASNIIVPFRNRESDWIEIRNLNMTGNPRYGLWIQGCHHVILSNIHLSIAETYDSEGPGLGMRFEARGGQVSGRWNEDVTLENIFVENSKGHAVEFWGTDGLEIGTVETRNNGGCGLLLNNNTNVHVQKVDAYRANYGGGYAGFRTANNCGPNIRVDTVISRECGRGIFSVSQSRDVTIDWVDISDCSGNGMLIEDSWDYTINGGIVRDNGGDAVRLASRTNEHEPAQNVTIQNLCITGNHSYGIRETSSGSGYGNTDNNFFLNNDLRGSASNPDRELVYEGANTVAEGNCVTGGPEYEDCGCESGAVETDCNGDPNGTAFIDDCGTCAGGNTSILPCSQDVEEGYYTIHPFHSNLCLTPNTSNGADQMNCDDGTAQVWQLIRDDNTYHIYNSNTDTYLSYGNGASGTYLSMTQNPVNWRLEDAGEDTWHFVIPENPDHVADVEGNSQDEGESVLLWTRNGNDNQRFTFEEVSTDCNGVPGGEAITDDCGRCVNGNTGMTPCTAYIDGPDACVYIGLIETQHEGFYHTGYLNGENTAENTIIWSIDADEASTTDITFRYAHGADDDRDMTLLINGETQHDAVNFSPTGAWDTWEVVTVSVDLSAGINTLELVALFEEGGPNIDLIAFDEEGYAGGSCEEDCNGDIGGSAYIDECGDCVGGQTGEEECIPVGLEATNNQNIYCYPNPASEEVHIEAEGAFNYTIHNSNGILMEHGTSMNYTVNKNNLPSGVYFIQVNTSTSHKTFKVIRK